MGKKKSASAAAAGESAPPVAPSPWASNYEAMKIVPITADPNLFLATDSLSQKINNRREGVEGEATSSSSSSASSAGLRRFQFGIYDSAADTIGRRAIALRTIKAGALLLSERGQPWIPHAEHADKVCHQCAACLYDPRIIEAKTPDGQKAPSRHLHCSECDAAFYCSPACQSKHKEVHELECAALQQVEEISDMAKVNVDLVRAAIKYVVGKGLEARKEKEAAASKTGDAGAANASSSSSSKVDAFDPFDFQSTASDSEMLMDNMAASSPLDLAHMRDAAALILKSTPTEAEFQLPADRIVSFLCRLNSNCHALNLEEHATIQFGFGLYPLCAIFNHSCYPNCIFINEGANLTFRVIRDVEPHEELTVNYVSLYAPRTVRRKELWVTKKFFCQCRRCNLRPKNEEEKAKFAIDGQLGGVSCMNLALPASAAGSSTKPSAASVKCPGYYRVNYQHLDAKAEAERKRKVREAKEKKRAAAAAADADAAAESNESVVEIDTSKPLESTVVEPEAVTAAVAGVAAVAVEEDDGDDSGDDEPGDFPVALRPKVTSCRCTVCHHNGNRDALIEVQSNALEKSEGLLALYGSGSKTPQTIKDEFEELLKSQSLVLTPQHGVIFNLLLPLVNVTSSLNEWKVKLDYCKRVIALAESCFPQHFLPLCNYYQALGNTYKSLLSKGIQESVPKKMLQKYKDERVAVLEKLAASMKICRGPEHILTLAAQRDVELAKKFRISV